MSKNNMITADMKIEEIVAKYPQAIGIFFQYGLGCVGCHAASFESLAEGATMHGIDLDAMLKDLNELASKVEAKKET
jgi:hybrid cluster-associated redox disulfide protein